MRSAIRRPTYCPMLSVTLRKLTLLADNRVRVSGARGRGVPATYKTSMTWADGWRAGTTLWCIGRRAADKARIFAEEALMRTRKDSRHGRTGLMTLPSMSLARRALGSHASAASSREGL